jgi:hypothetical protein
MRHGVHGTTPRTKDASEQALLPAPHSQHAASCLNDEAPHSQHAASCLNDEAPRAKDASAHALLSASPLHRGGVTSAE